jgi:hypothetical protein
MTATLAALGGGPRAKPLRPAPDPAPQEVFAPGAAAFGSFVASDATKLLRKTLRGLELTISRNRLNVAISRAKCLAYLVASPRLLDANCRTVEQMRLANALCRLVDVAEERMAA